MTATLPTLEEICGEFEELVDGSERLEYLIEIGRTLPSLPEAARIEANRVQGCQSNVWLIAEQQAGPPGRLFFQAESDAPMVQGLVAILLAAYSGHTADEILRFAPEALFERLKLRTFLSPMRSNGLHSMVLHVRALATRALESQGVAATAEPPRPGPQRTAASAERLSDQEVRAVRADFPILSAVLDDGRPLVYLDNAATSQRPRSVIQSMVEAYEGYFSNVHRGGHQLAARTTERYEAARQSARRLLNARHAHEIVFTSGTTGAINLVARSWGDANVRAGDEIVLTLLEHHSNLVPWQQLAERTGCRLRYAGITADGHLDLDDFARQLSDRTRLVAVTAASNVLGTLVPVESIVRLARAAGAAVLVDAAQAAPHLALDVQALDVDWLAFSGHKMLGPTGIGILYGKEAVLDAMPPFLGGGSMIRTVTRAGFEPALLPAKFEAGTPPITAAIGLGAAIEYLLDIGLERIHATEQALALRAHEALAGIAGLRILGPAAEDKGGTVTFVVDGTHPDDLAKVLDARGVAVRSGHHCAMPLHAHLGLSASCRASFYFYNTPAEIDVLADGVREAQRLLTRAGRTKT